MDDLTPMLQKSSAETAGARSSRNFGGPGPRVFDFTCSATTGKAQNTPVLAAKARLKRFVSNSFATLGLTPTKDESQGRHDLVVSQKWAQRQALNNPAFFRDFRVVFLSDDYSMYLELVDHTKLRIETSEGLFHRILSAVKGDFLALLRQIEKQNDPEIYWRTALASRNSAGVPLLRNLCYVLVARAFVEAGPADAHCFIVQSPATADAVASVLNKKLSRRASVKMTVFERLAPVLERPRLLMKAGYFVAASLRQWLKARRLKLRRITPDSTHQRPLTILRSWITKGTVEPSKQGSPAVYRDRNYGDLPNYLQTRGQRVALLPMYFNLPKLEVEVMSDLEQIDFEVLHPEIYLSMSDFFRVTWKSLREAGLHLKHLSFRNIPVAGLVREAHLSTCCSLSLMRLNLADELIRTLAEQGYHIDHVIYPIENNAPEKVLLRALRRDFPRTRVSGFQHTVWYKEQLGMSLAPGEAETHPLPDRIFCSGRKYLDILSGENFPRNLLRLGANLRYTDVNRYANESPVEAQPEKPSSPVPSLLVVLNFDWNHTFEMLAKLARALRELPPVAVKIKPHPVLNESRLRAYLERIEFAHFSFLGGRVQDAVNASDAVVMTAGSVSNLEVLALGVPLIRVSLANNFDFECLWDDDPDFLFGDSPDELSRRLREVLFESSEVRQRFRAKAARIVADYFEPVSDEKLSLFL